MSIWCDVFKLLYLSIHLYISLTEWHIDSCSNKAFDSKMFLFFVTFYETPCIGYIYVLYVSIDQDISGLMMNILIMQTIRPIIAFYFIFLFMLIRHSSSNKTVAIASYSITIRQIICLNEVFYFSSQTTFQNSTWNIAWKIYYNSAVNMLNCSKNVQLHFVPKIK